MARYTRYTHPMNHPNVISTAQAAKRIGVSKNTLLRWISEGLIPDVKRDWRRWRVWTEEDIQRANAFKQAYHDRPAPAARRRLASRSEYARSAAESMARFGRAFRRARGASP